MLLHIPCPMSSLDVGHNIIPEPTENPSFRSHAFPRVSSPPLTGEEGVRLVTELKAPGDIITSLGFVKISIAGFGKRFGQSAQATGRDRGVTKHW